MTVRASAALIPYELPQAVGGSGVAAVDVIADSALPTGSERTSCGRRRPTA